MRSEPANILLVTTDQQRTDSLSCAGSAFADTRCLDRLAAEGAYCGRAYTTNPVCTPARVALFTGCQVSAHGAWNIGVNAPETSPMIAHRLAEAGYRTHSIGKLHFQPFGATAEQSQEGFARWSDPAYTFDGPYYGFQSVELALGHATYGMRGHYGAWVQEQVGEAERRRFEKATPLSPISFGGEAFDWDLPAHLHNSVWTADQAIAFLRRHDRSQPFFLNLGFQDPHHPHCVPRDFTERVCPADVPAPDYEEGELADKPPHFAVARRGELETSVFRGEYPIAGQGAGADFRQVPPEEALRGRAYYYSLVRLIDRQMGRVLDYLEEVGLAENTLVIFTSDHGELLGDHGLWMKGPFHYEQIVRVPLLLRWPRGFAGGRRTEAVLSHLDLVPTMLAAAGLPTPTDLGGFDLLPLLQGHTDSVREGAMIECVDDPRTLRLKTFVTPERKLTWYQNQTFGELYDLALDPGEKRNLWDDPAYAADKSRLLSCLLGQMEPLERRAPRHSYA